MRSPHRKIFCESGIGNHDTIPIQYEKRTSKNSSVINDNKKNNFRIFHGSSPTDGERYDSTYAFSTEAKDIKSFENSDNLKLVPETNPQVQNISRNKKIKLNIIPNFKNDDLANITNDSMYTNSNFSDDIWNVDPNKSILKLTKQVQENINSVKEDFDNFLQRTDNKSKIQNFWQNLRKR